ncbi:unnamed protein product [Paramecium sonneborni]|uniref:Uncharacterized protein n=1 Tax=Paramecium sonneborni TaxID=65129 RepID=A0A8S1R3F9_9CILI|nr:unnamed protein product [Paramecium sonneborni]
MGACKICSQGIVIHVFDIQLQDSSQPISSQENLKSQQVSVSSSSLPSELQEIKKQETKNNLNNLNIKQTVSLWRSSSNTEKLSNNDDLQKNQTCLQQIDEISRSQLRNDTHFDENNDRQQQQIQGLSSYFMLESRQSKRSENLPTIEGTPLRDDFVYSKPKKYIEEQLKTL